MMPKYRVWIGGFGDMMHRVDAIHWYADDDVWVKSNTLGPDFYQLGPTNILMQFTTMKDKNGVEIYAGDIIRRPNHRDTHTTEYWNEVVEWCGDSWSISVMDCDECEVVGNIYQNPGLIN